MPGVDPTYPASRSAASSASRLRRPVLGRPGGTATVLSGLTMHIFLHCDDRCMRHCALRRCRFAYAGSTLAAHADDACWLRALLLSRAALGWPSSTPHPV